MIMTGLLIIFFLVLLLPFTLKAVEHNLELFLFAMGVLAALIGGMFNGELFLKAAGDPIKISAAVLAAGLLFKWLKSPLEKTIMGMSRMMPFRLFSALTVVVLGLVSSIITAIIAALVLVLIVGALRLERQAEVRFTVLACFSIGLGAALTPIGEPLSTIAISKLNEDFFFLVNLIGPEVIAAITALAIMAMLLIQPPDKRLGSFRKDSGSETYEEILVRSMKVYLFVMGLTFLGAGFEPLIKQYLIGQSPVLLYWVNMISAILDNATLAAAEISPAMDHFTIQSILLGLLISGGMLIPGNIPNIISASKLKITSKEWAKFGVPVGLITMFAYYLAIMWLEHR
jgi:predicted cation transporter